VEAAHYLLKILNHKETNQMNWDIINHAMVLFGTFFVNFSSGENLFKNKKSTFTHPIKISPKKSKSGLIS